MSYIKFSQGQALHMLQGKAGKILMGRKLDKLVNLLRRKRLLTLLWGLLVLGAVLRIAGCEALR